MPDAPLATPVAFFVFNRPATTRRAFAAIARARPARLFLVADGARPDRAGEAERVAEVRRIVTQVDWPCDVRTAFSDLNLGSRRRVSSGISWVFEQVDRAIILEDDCVASQAFFRYCTAMLARYERDPRVFSISGSNFARAVEAPGHYFSRFALMWGWATWRDRWARYDLSAGDWRRVVARTWWRRPLALAYWWKIFDELQRRRMDAWDYQWILTLWRNGGLACRPTLNLVENVGFGPDATHTKAAESRLAGLAAVECGDDFATAVGPVAPDLARDALDEREWARLDPRSLLLMYVPWLERLRSRARRRAADPLPPTERA